ncbi:MAG: exodeoxyribonuclease VII large subunit [Clostridia bacterium]
MLNTLTVTEFNNYIKNIFVAEEMLHNVAILGEISGFRISGAHAYFSLKDKGGILQCSCFQYKKTYVPKEGESVVVVGSPDYYVAGGRFSFIVSKIEAVGIGLLFQKIEELKLKLLSEGIFDESHKKVIPKFSKNIVVVTSKTGAVIRDIFRTIRKKNPLINIVVKDVKVQGEFAVNEITLALNAVDKLGYDCVILARGGGSLEDLMPFYDEAVVRAVYNMETPIISAVGHETDFTLCDFAADARAATPTAAGELVAYDFYQTHLQIVDMVNRMKLSVNKNLETDLHKTKFLTSSVLNGVERLYKDNMSRLKMMDMRMFTAVTSVTKNKEFLVEKMINTLDNLNPARILKSGYFKVYKGVNPVLSVKNVNIGDIITVKGIDGKLSAEVNTIVEENL